jgi:hypothetical protein
VVEVTRLPAADVQQLELYKTLPQGISANSQADASAIVLQMAKDVKAAHGVKPTGGSTGGSG